MNKKPATFWSLTTRKKTKTTIPKFVCSEHLWQCQFDLIIFIYFFGGKFKDGLFFLLIKTVTLNGNRNFTENALRFKVSHLIILCIINACL